MIGVWSTVLYTGWFRR